MRVASRPTASPRWSACASCASSALDAYLRADEPYDCAGAAKIESLGIALVEQVLSDDPTALIGLPLIRLTTMLANAGVAVLPSE